MSIRERLIKSRMPIGDAAEVDPSEFENYVEHPRYGRGPRMTGVSPTMREVHFLGYDAGIPGTAIPANPIQPGCAPAQYYVDVRCQCEACQRKFIFFAEEQRHWYDELGFHYAARATRCSDCRRAKRKTDEDRDRLTKHLSDGVHSAEDCEDLTAALERLHAKSLVGRKAIEAGLAALNAAARSQAH